MRKYWVKINKWKGDEMFEEVDHLTLPQAEQIVANRFGEIQWSDTQVGFQVHEELRDEEYDLLFAEGGPELWEVSMVSENGLEDWNEELLTEPQPEQDEEVPWVGMAWAIAEHDSPGEVLEGCLLVVANTAEEAYEQIVEQIRLIEPDSDPREALEGYFVVVREAK